MQKTACGMWHSVVYPQNQLRDASQGMCPVSFSLPTHAAAKAEKGTDRHSPTHSDGAAQ